MVAGQPLPRLVVMRRVGLEAALDRAPRAACRRAGTSRTGRWRSPGTSREAGTTPCAGTATGGPCPEQGILQRVRREVGEVEQAAERLHQQAGELVDVGPRLVAVRAEVVLEDVVRQRDGRRRPRRVRVAVHVRVGQVLARREDAAALVDEVADRDDLIVGQLRGRARGLRRVARDQVLAAVPDDGVEVREDAERVRRDAALGVDVVDDGSMPLARRVARWASR